MIQKTRNAPPRAGAMLEALRGLGYSTAAALADIIDNSISAGANQVRINFFWDHALSRISVLDNGKGMSDEELESAMRLGDKSPLDERSKDDLGRFGMGLKTASFSQCRRLTVASIKHDKLSCLRWDLDELAANENADWLLFEGPAGGSEDFISQISEFNQGTLVLWEQLDRIVTTDYQVDDFLGLISRIEAHLSMIFHRLIEGRHPKLTIYINSKPIAPWDPFMIGHAGKPWNSPIARRITYAGQVEVECHVLPHHDKLTSDEFERAGGIEGWTAQQGFYVYRNERLLVAGGWLGLGNRRAWNREESHRLARIRLDIPNTADAEWKIDIRKSIARPPVSIRPWLTRIAEDTRERARKVFAYRGSPVQVAGAAPIQQAWRIERLSSGIHYKIDEKHPVISSVMEEAGSILPLVKAMLRVIEETVPVQRIWLDTVENKDTPSNGFTGEPPEDVISVMKVIFDDMVKRKGMSPELAKKAILSIEPFNAFPILVNSLN